RELESFAYTVAHDLRAPVRAMTGFAAILLEDTRSLSGDSRHIARRIVDAGQRMDRLLQDLLAYSRLSREDLPLSPVDLAALCSGVLSDLRGEIAQRGADVVVRGGLPVVLGHTIPLTVALNNLLSNALKFVAPGTLPRVEIGAERRDGFVRLWIQDNGIGVPSEYREKIFGVFERLHGQEDYPGTGIGLALVRRAAERMGGAAGLESTPEPGSRFYLDLVPASPPRI
ncbi:MAG TPA: ATP-binding protein, partial [Planctomycetota bacterium]|nr:ATP-binding protein [Planctomycetota bacterium]